MVRLAWFLVRAAVWLGVVSLFMPAFALRETVPASQFGVVDERPAQDTLTPSDRVTSWRKPQSY
jgi:hypothetical protein